MESEGPFDGLTLTRRVQEKASSFLFSFIGSHSIRDGSEFAASMLGISVAESGSTGVVVESDRVVKSATEGAGAFTKSV